MPTTWYAPRSIRTANNFGGVENWLNGSIQALTFDTDIPEWTIYLNQRGSDQESIYITSRTEDHSSQPITMDWIVNLYSFNLSHSPTFYVYLVDGTQESDASSTGSFFNITVDSDPATATAAGRPRTTTINNTTLPAGVTRSEPRADSSETNDSAQIGIGIGTALGILVVALLAVIAYLLWRRQQLLKEQARAMSRSSGGQRMRRGTDGFGWPVDSMIVNPAHGRGHAQHSATAEIALPDLVPGEDVEQNSEQSGRTRNRRDQEGVDRHKRRQGLRGWFR